MILLQVQLSLTYLDFQHEGIPSAFAGLVQRPVQACTFSGIPQLCYSELVLSDQQLCSCHARPCLPKSTLGKAIEFTAQETCKQRKLVLEHTFSVLLLCVMQAVDCSPAHMCQRIHNTYFDAQYLLLPAISKSVVWLHRMTCL